MKNYTEKTGGLKKYLKELNTKKTQMINVKRKDVKNTSKRLEISKITIKYYRRFILTAKVKKKTIELGLVLSILEKEITNVISTQMSKKAPGPDQISNKMLKITWSVTASF